jgi:phenylpyruvate tautomerase PptA (4-oxalocrotonate tautomerase family)
MPLYRCTIAEGLTTYDQRLRIAKEITRIHCEVTGAPPLFVHAFFIEDREKMMAEGTRAIVVGSIRAGRTGEQKERIVSHIKEAFAGICAVEADQMIVALIDVPARWVMEGGAIMPEPGEESVWLEKHVTS